MRESTHREAVISVVIPAFNEQSILGELLSRTAKVLAELKVGFEMIVVDDGSRDSTWQVIQDWASRDERVRGLKFSRNFGKENATSAGLSLAKGDAVVVMDADLQHPPEVITDLVERWKQGYAVVEGKKSSRGQERWYSKLSAWAFYSVFGALCGFDLRDHSDFKLLDRRVVEAWLEMGERNLFFRGMIAWLGFRRTTVEFEVGDRGGGRTRWSRLGLLNLAVSALTAFSSIPLRVVTFTGLVFLVFALALGVQTLFQWASGQALGGFTTVILLVLIASSVLMLALGVIGEYLARMYDEIKARPRYVVESECGPGRQSDRNQDQTAPARAADEISPRA